MARGVSTKLLTQLPAEYSADWLERIDRRTKIWRAILPRIQQLQEDAGGVENLTHAKRSLCRRAAFLELLCETQELKFTAGEPADVGAYTQAFNSMLGAYRVLGLERRSKPVETLHSLMSQPDDPVRVPDAASEATAADRSATDDIPATQEIAAEAPCTEAVS